MQASVQTHTLISQWRVAFATQQFAGESVRRLCGGCVVEFEVIQALGEQDIAFVVDCCPLKGSAYMSVSLSGVLQVHSEIYIRTHGVCNAGPATMVLLLCLLSLISVLLDALLGMRQAPFKILAHMHVPPVMQG